MGQNCIAIAILRRLRLGYQAKAGLCCKDGDTSIYMVFAADADGRLAVELMAALGACEAAYGAMAKVAAVARSITGLPQVA